MADTRPPSNVTTRTRWTNAEEAQLADLAARKEKAYKEGAANIAEVLVGSGWDQATALNLASQLIPLAGALRDALAPFDDKAGK